MRYPILKSRDVYQLDKHCQEKVGIPVNVLMENAGHAVATVCMKLSPKYRPRFLIVCGKGNNGADGMVAARHLANNNYYVDIVVLASISQLSGLSAQQWKTLKAFKKIRMHAIPISQWKKIEKLAENNDYIVDGLFGVGLSGKLREPYGDIIRMLNQTNKKIIAIDVPSGIDSDNGKSCGAYIRAKKTVTFHGPKKGLMENDGKKAAGGLVVVDIGIPY